eukprot:2079290-Alexandrium_andersonii.AAC.1
MKGFRMDNFPPANWRGEGEGKGKSPEQKGRGKRGKKKSWSWAGEGSATVPCAQGLAHTELARATRVAGHTERRLKFLEARKHGRFPPSLA